MTDLAAMAKKILAVQMRLAQEGVRPISPNDDPVTCDGCGATVPHGEVAQDYAIARLGSFCEDCAPAMRGCVRVERSVPYRAGA